MIKYIGKMLGIALVASISSFGLKGEEVNLDKSPRKVVESQLEEKIEEKDEGKLEFAGSIDTLFANKYIPANGFDIKGGPVNQSSLTLGLKNVLNIGDYLAVTGWGNIAKDFKGDLVDKTVEVDGILSYDSGSIFNTGSIFRNLDALKGDLSLNTNVQYWEYPNKFLGNHDIISELGAVYSGEVNLATTWRHLWEHKGVQSGDYFLLSASRNFPIGKIGGDENGWTVALTPDMTAVYSDDFLIGGNDWNLKPTGTITLSNPSNNFSVRVVGGYNVNLGDKETREIKRNQPIVQIGFTYRF
ncbi:MAG: hypothetical protein Q7S27_00540 [Nanoarchaeota archaeon]|nr:hypothetical protein [Nanoarchaeota archaeon]